MWYRMDVWCFSFALKTRASTPQAHMQGSRVYLEWHPPECVCECTSADRTGWLMPAGTAQVRL